MTDKAKIMEVLKEKYKEVEDMGYEIVGVFLQGSQNYGLDYDGSDIDTKAILLPKFEDFVLCKQPTSTTHVCEDNSHIDLKDIRLMFDCFKKQNVNFVEILFTEYYIMNPKYEALYKPMFDNAEKIAKYNNYASINCLVGMAYEKQKALCHPYPTLAYKIEKYGYDNKQLHHIFRLNTFLYDYFYHNKPYSECLFSDDLVKRNELIKIKSDYIFTVEVAKGSADIIVKNMADFKDNYMKENPLVVDKEVEKIMNDVLINIIRHNFQKELGI